MTRRPYIDWIRGLAVVVMMEWHVIDSWSVTGGRDSAAFSWVAFVGGWAAPLFLYLAGVSVALAGASRLRRGHALGAASWAVQKRGWQIFGIAHVFRLQTWMMSFGAPWTSLFKPDILNILGLGMVATAFSWGRSDTRAGRAFWLLVPAAAILLLTPASRLWAWPTILPERLEAYIRPVNRAGVFQLFPSAAYVFIGAWIGSLIAAPRPETVEGRFHARIAAGGALLIAAGYVGSMLQPLASSSDFWTSSVSLPLMRAGAMTTALAGAWLWMRRPTARHWSPFVLLGRTSLFVYWVHIELAYGILSQPIHHTLALPWAVAALTAFVVALTGAAFWWSRWTPPRLFTLRPLALQSSARQRP